MVGKNFKLMLGSGLLALILGTAPAFAQTVDDQNKPSAGDATTEGTDIVVTALRRTERLQDVPASVAALTGDTLTEKSSTSYRDYLNTIPSVSYVSNGSYKDKIFIRGVAEGLSARTLATTGIYLDEASLTEVDASLADVGTFDIDRVEVLRGPQGTLYGSGSMGGTVRIITAKPKIGKFEALADAGVGTVRDGGTNYSMSAAVNAPISDNFAFRVGGSYRRDAGFIDNVFAPRAAKDVNDATHLGARAQLLFRPSDDFSILAGFTYERDRYHYNATQDAGADRTVTRRYPEYNNFNTKIYSLTIEKDFGFAKLISATNYIDKDAASGRDITNVLGGLYPVLTGSPLPADQGLGLIYAFPNKLFSQEARLSSNGSGPLTWLVGAYYSRFSPTNQQYFDTKATPGLVGYNFYTTVDNVRRSSIAGFGEVSYEVVKGLKLTAGYRRTTIKTHEVSTASGFLNGDVTDTTELRSSETAGTQKYAASYQISRDNLIYAQAAQGFRPGGPIDSFPTTCTAELQSLGFSTPPTQYNSDRLWQYEVGSKNNFFGRRLTINAAAYLTDWTDIQVARNLNCGPQFIVNAGKVKTKGVELEVSATPVAGLELTGSGGYTDAQLRTTIPDIGAVAGDPLPNVPRWTASVSARYETELSADVRGFIRGDYQYVSGRYADFKALGPTRSPYDPAYSLVNLRTGVNFGSIAAEVYLTNVFDRNVVVNSSRGNGLRYENVVRPRTLGLSLHYRY